MDTNNILMLAVLFIALIATWYLLPRFLVRRAMFKVVRIFREHNAVSRDSARTAEELGINKRQLLRLTRDYQPLAIQLMMRLDVIQTTNDGKLYLSENKLSQVRGQHI